MRLFAIFGLRFAAVKYQARQLALVRSDPLSSPVGDFHQRPHVIPTEGHCHA